MPLGSLYFLHLFLDVVSVSNIYRCKLCHRRLEYITLDDISVIIHV